MPRSPLKKKLQSLIDCGKIINRQTLVEIAAKNKWHIVRNGKNYLTMLLPNGDRFRLHFDFNTNSKTQQRYPPNLIADSHTVTAPPTDMEQHRVYSVYALIAISPAGRMACYIGLTVDLNRRFNEHTKKQVDHKTSYELFEWARTHNATVRFCVLHSLRCSQSDAMKCESHWGKLAISAGYEAPGIERWLKRPKLWKGSSQPFVWPSDKVAAMLNESSPVIPFLIHE